MLFRQSVNNTIISNTVRTNGRSNQSANDNVTRAMGIWLTEGADFNKIVNNSITTNGSNFSIGILLGAGPTGLDGLSSASNNSLTYNYVTSGGTNERNYGIHLNNSASQNNISHNIIFTRGNTQNQGVRLENATDNRVENNTIATNGTTTSNAGILLATNSDRTAVIGNNIKTNGTSSNYGIWLLTNVNYSFVFNNTIFTNGSLGTNYGLVFDTVAWNNGTDNRIWTFGNMTAIGMLVSTGDYNILSNNSIITHSWLNAFPTTNNEGVQLTSTSTFNIIQGNNIVTNGTGSNYGIRLASGGNNTIHNNTVFTSGNSTANYGIYVSGATARYSNISWNRVNTTGNRTAYGIYLSAGNNYLVWNNNISTFGKNGSSQSAGIVFITSNSTVWNNDIQTGGTDQNYGIWFFTPSQNNTVENNTIRTYGNASTNYGIYFNTVHKNAVRGNQIRATNGTDTNVGVRISTSNYSEVINNTIFTNGTSQFNFGILSTAGTYSTIWNNTISTYGTNDNDCITLQTTPSHNNSVEYNTGRCSGTTTANAGLALITTHNTNVTFNDFHTVGGTQFGYTMYVSGRMNLIANNSLNATGNTDTIMGIYMTDGANFNNVSENNISTNCSSLCHGIGIWGASPGPQNNSLHNNIVGPIGGGPGTSTSYGLYVEVATGNNVSNTKFMGVEQQLWVNSNGASNANNLTNVTFGNANGTVRFPGNRTVAGTQTFNSDQLNITLNRTILHGTTALVNVLNSSAFISINITSLIAAGATDTAPAQDPHDAEVFVTCTADRCTEISETADQLYFNVSKWSAYSAQAASTVIACGDTLTSNTVMVEDLSSTGGCFTIGADDVTLNCDGFKITFDTDGVGDVSAIEAVNKRNIAVKNCFIQDANINGAFGLGINFTSVNFSTISNNTIITNGTTNDYGVFLQSSSLYNVITNNTVRARGSGTQNMGIHLSTTASLNNITHNVIFTNGTTSNQGIRVITTSGNNTIFNNTVESRGTSTNSYGIEISTTSRNMTIDSNTVTTIGSAGSGHGIVLSDTQYSYIINNDITAGSGGSSNGIFISASLNNTAKYNRITTTFANSHGVLISSSSSDNNVTNNSASTNAHSSGANSAYAVSIESTSHRNNIVENNLTGSAVITPAGGVRVITGSSNNNFIRNKILATGSLSNNTGIRLQNATNTTFQDNIVTTTNLNGFALFVFSSNFTVVKNDTYLNPTAWINQTSDSNTTFSNITFRTENGSLRYNQTIFVNGTLVLSLAELNITNNKIYLNASNATMFNTSADLLLNLSGLDINNAFAYVDYDHDNVYSNCFADVCTNTSYTNSVFTFNVSHWTSFKAGGSLNITDCQTITSQGLFNVSNDLITTQASCLNVTSANVIVDCQGKTIMGSQVANSHGINASSRNNLTIQNCRVFNFTDGLFFARVTNATIFNNTFGNNTDDGIDFGNVNFSVISHNNLSGDADTGIEISGWFNNITNNSFNNIRGAATSHGVQTFRASSTTIGSGPTSINIINNTFYDIQNDGINVAWLNFSVIANNTFWNITDDALSITNGTALNITGNNVGAGGDDGLVLTGTNYSFIAFNNVSERTGQNVDITESNNNNFTNNTLFYGSLDMLRIRQNSANNTFWNTTIFSNNSWFSINNSIENNNFTNTTFANSNGSIRLSFFQANISQEVNTSNLNISNNRTFLNATNLSNMNSSAFIVLDTAGLTFTLPEIGVDYGDTRTYVSCPADVCNASTISGTKYMFNVSHWTSYRVQEQFTALTLTRPFNIVQANDTTTTDRIINFNWSNSTSSDGSVVSYQLVIATSPTFSSASVIYNKTNIDPIEGNSTNQTINFSLDVDATYWWRVIPNSSTTFGEPSNITNFTVQSLLSLVLINNSVNFSYSDLGTQNDTDDNQPFPFKLENNGNLPINISITSTRLFISETTDYPTNKYRFKIRVNETNAFDTSLSNMSYINFSSVALGKNIADLNWTNGSDDAYVDVNITVPLDEPAGLRNATVTFTVLS